MKEKLKSKKITMATLKSFIRKNDVLTKTTSSFDGMVDGVRSVEDSFRTVSKIDAIGHNGVYCVGDSREYMEYFENAKYYGIKVSNSCGSGLLVTAK